MAKPNAHLPDDLRNLVASGRRDRERANAGYRARALHLFAPVCARCGRDFAGRRLRELTVHHKDHDHNNNPLDGSNWELLCVYCHENEHDRKSVANTSNSDERAAQPATHQPFAGLKQILGEPET